MLPFFSGVCVDIFSPQVRRQTVESLDFYQRYETLLRTEVEKKKAHLYKRQAKLANQVQWMVCQACLTSLKPEFLILKPQWARSL